MTSDAQWHDSDGLRVLNALNVTSPRRIAFCSLKRSISERVIQPLSGTLSFTAGVPSLWLLLGAERATVKYGYFQVWIGLGIHLLFTCASVGHFRSLEEIFLSTPHDRITTRRCVSRVNCFSRSAVTQRVESVYAVFSGE